MTVRETIEREVETRLAQAMPEVDLLEVSLLGQGGAGTLRAVVDHPAGVDHALCAQVTKTLEGAGLLDRYAIEVWSPGPEPPLRTPEHFRRAVGGRVRVKVEPAGAGPRARPVKARTRTGTLVAVGEASITLDSGDERLEIPLADVRRAQALADES